jgi:hypothetical protein
VHSYRDPTGVGGIGAPSRSAFVDRRVLLTPDSLPGLILLSLPSAGCFASVAFLGGKTGLNAAGWGATARGLDHAAAAKGGCSDKAICPSIGFGVSPYLAATVASVPAKCAAYV